MPITKRTLTKWRKEALEFKQDEYLALSKFGNPAIRDELIKRILKMTQELLDQHLLK